MAYAKFVYETLKKRSNSLLTKEEFIRFFREQYLVRGINSTVEIYQRLITDPTLAESKDHEDEEESEGKDSRPQSYGSPSRKAKK